MLIAGYFLLLSDVPCPFKLFLSVLSILSQNTLSSVSLSLSDLVVS